MLQLLISRLIYCLNCDQTTTLPCPDFCADRIISGIEECENGYTIQYNGCFDCKFQCQLQCTTCIKISVRSKLI
ncbi:unnamed protein product [Paramecium sonneborni]|uniref:Uncharacterized protein n=1 Tax=Paramecium sonneborni TaxID=65129 RepID=A0A8S1RUP4_9CILI|nr:unnamed protein product [Paramecium sonneborni]